MSTGASSTHLTDAHRYGRRILVCLDRSALSEVCIPHAVSIARTFGSAVTLAHVMQPSQGRAGAPTNDALVWEIARQEARGYLESFEKQLSLTLERPVETRLEQGRPAERIVELAREIAADLIMLGTRGAGGSPVGTLGSTVQQVLSAARSSVFVAHSSASVPATPSKRILVPLDGSLRTESVLPVAARLATAQGAEMLLIHVVQEPLPSELLRADDDIELARKLAARLEVGAKRYLERLQEQLAHDGAAVRTVIARHASAQQCIVEISQKEQAELIVLSAHGATCDSSRSFGSVAAYLLTHSKVPLLVLQDLPERGPHADSDLDGKRAPPPLRASFAPENV